MKKVLLINGSPHEAGCTFTALSEIEASLKKHGIESDLLYLGKSPVRLHGLRVLRQSGQMRLRGRGQ